MELRHIEVMGFYNSDDVWKTKQKVTHKIRVGKFNNSHINCMGKLIQTTDQQNIELDWLKSETLSP